MKKYWLSLLIVAVMLSCNITAGAVPTDIKEVYNGVTNSVGDLYSAGGMSKEHSTVIVSKIAELDGAPVNGSGVNVINEYTFDTDETLPWAGFGYIASGSVAYKEAWDKVYAPVTSDGVYFAGYGWNSATAYAKTTFQFDLYTTKSSDILRIWPAGAVNSERPGFNLKSGGTVGLVQGYDASGSTFSKTMPVNSWVNFAVEYDATNALATLYMDGVEIYTLPMTGRTYTPSDFSINCSGTIYMDNIYMYEGEYVQNYGMPEAVYLDQNTSAYSTALEVMFGQELEEGYYQAKMGTVSDTSNAETVNFIVGDFEVDPADKLTVLDQAEAYGTDEGQTWYKKSFLKTVSFDEYNSFKSIKLISGDGTRCIGAISFGNYASDGKTPGYSWDKASLTGSGEVTIALQMYAIPEDSTDLNLYFSTDTVTAIN